MGRSDFIEDDGDAVVFRDHDELVETLGSRDFSSRARRQAGLREDQGERYALQHYLVPQSNVGALQVPLEIQKTERPDFLLEVPTETWGVEISQTTTREINRDLARSRKNQDAALVEYTVEGHQMVPAGGALTSRGFAGHQNCYRVAELVGDAFDRKTESLNKLGFGLHQRNQLLLLDTYGGAIALWDRHLSQGKTVRGMGTPTPICLRPSATPGTASC